MKAVAFASGNPATFFQGGCFHLGYSLLDPRWSDWNDSFESIILENVGGQAKLLDEMIKSMQEDEDFWEPLEETCVILADTETLCKFFRAVFPEKQVHNVCRVFECDKEKFEPTYTLLDIEDKLMAHCKSVAEELGTELFYSPTYFTSLFEYVDEMKKSSVETDQEPELKKLKKDDMETDEMNTFEKECTDWNHKKKIERKERLDSYIEKLLSKTRFE